MPTPFPVRLRLPATSANLGPGFDALGLALSLYLIIEAELAAEASIRATGRNPELCGSLSDNLILSTYTDILAQHSRPAPSLALDIQNEIPLGIGCGSSAAALLAGVLLANHFGQLGWSPEQILDEACRREGHPDNVAACLYGGMTASAITDLRTLTATFGRTLDWQFLLALPTESLSTTKARALLPETYPRRDAISNVQATALLVSAFALDRLDLLPVAMADCLHQPFRADACPLLPALLPLIGQHGIAGIALSGAGPAVLLIASTATPLDPIRKRISSVAGTHLAELLELQIGDPAKISPLAR